MSCNDPWRLQLARPPDPKKICARSFDSVAGAFAEHLEHVPANLAKGVKVCARLPQSLVPDAIDDDESCFFEMRFIEYQEGGKIVVVEDMSTATARRKPISISSTDVFVPPMEKGGSGVRFVNGESVLARWDDDKATAYYSATVVEAADGDGKRLYVQFQNDLDDEGMPKKRAIDARKIVRDVDLGKRATPVDPSDDDEVSDAAAAAALAAGDAQQGDFGGEDDGFVLDLGAPDGDDDGDDDKAMEETAGDDLPDGAWSPARRPRQPSGAPICSLVSGAAFQRSSEDAGPEPRDRSSPKKLSKKRRRASTDAIAPKSSEPSPRGSRRRAAAAPEAPAAKRSRRPPTRRK